MTLSRIFPLRHSELASEFMLFEMGYRIGAR